MKATGTIQIEEIDQGVKLKNPTLEITNVYLECLFTDEDGTKHSRMQLINADKENKLIKDAIKIHKLLKQFK